MSDKNNKSTNGEQLTDTYHKARRLLALFSGILIAWEYLGISIGAADSKSVSAKLPIADTPVTLRNPEVFPVVIITLVLYFAFRLAVEWNQCDKRRRALFPSQVDLLVSYILAGGAVLLYVFQQTLTFRLADFLTPLNAIAVVAGILVPLYIMGLIKFLPYLRGVRIDATIALRLTLFFALLFSLLIGVLILLLLPTKRTLAFSFIIASIVTIGVLFLLTLRADVASKRELLGRRVMEESSDAQE